MIAGSRTTAQTHSPSIAAVRTQQCVVNANHPNCVFGLCLLSYAALGAQSAVLSPWGMSRGDNTIGCIETGDFFLSGTEITTNHPRSHTDKDRQTHRQTESVAPAEHRKEGPAACRRTGRLGATVYHLSHPGDNLSHPGDNL